MKNLFFYFKIVVVILAIYALVFSANHEQTNIFDILSIVCLTACVIYAIAYVLVSVIFYKRFN